MQTNTVLHKSVLYSSNKDWYYTVYGLIIRSILDVLSGSQGNKRVSGFYILWNWLEVMTVIIWRVIMKCFMLQSHFHDPVKPPSQWDEYGWNLDFEPWTSLLISVWFLPVPLTILLSASPCFCLSYFQVKTVSCVLVGFSGWSNLIPLQLMSVSLATVTLLEQSTATLSAPRYTPTHTANCWWPVKPL